MLTRGGGGSHVLNPGHHDSYLRDKAGGSVWVGRETSTCRGMATVGSVPGRQFLPAFGAAEKYPVERQDHASWQSPREVPHTGEEKEIFLPQIFCLGCKIMVYSNQRDWLVKRTRKRPMMGVMSIPEHHRTSVKT